MLESEAGMTRVFRKLSLKLGATRLNVSIWKVFQANGIKIPFPQREVRLLRPDPAGTETGPVEGALQSNRPS
jgi:small-conductance mechanosensitive channel